MHERRDSDTAIGDALASRLANLEPIAPERWSATRTDAHGAPLLADALVDPHPAVRFAAAAAMRATAWCLLLVTVLEEHRGGGA